MYRIFKYRFLCSIKTLNKKIQLYKFAMDSKNNKHQNPYEGLTLPPDFESLSKNKQK